MPYTALTFKVMLASPSDVANERRVAREVIHEWNAVNADDRHIVLLPVGWESHASPFMGHRPQEVINRQILRDSDLLVAIFLTRLGSPTGKSASGTLEEIEEHLAAGKPAMIYFSSAPVRPDSVEEEQYRALREFKDQCRQRGLVQEYESISEFRELFARQLAQTVIRDIAPARAGEPGGSSGEGSEGAAPRERGWSEEKTDIFGNKYTQHYDESGTRTGWSAERMGTFGDRYTEHYGDSDSPAASSETREKSADIPSLSASARELLTQAAGDEHGVVLAIATLGGFSLETNGKNLLEDASPRSEARWRGTLRELATLGLIEQRDEKGEIYAMTDKGYHVADVIQGLAG